MDRKEMIDKLENVRLNKITELSQIEKENPYLHWSDSKFKLIEKLNSEIQELFGKIEILEENKDMEEIKSLLKTGEYSWIDIKSQILI